MTYSTLPTPEFFDRAACQGQDPELFFPLDDEGAVNLAQIAQAKAVCYRCPVEADCLSWALGTGQDDGIWGGTTGQDRRAIRVREAAS